jgi:SAM-dependent methyltransferase
MPSLCTPTGARNATVSPVAADPDPLTPAYEALGIDGYYREHGDTYRNPHEDAVRDALAVAVRTWSPDLSCVLDLACGSGEATLALRFLGARHIDGIDPYTAAAYLARTGLTAASWRFEDIALGALAAPDRSVCSRLGANDSAGETLVADNTVAGGEGRRWSLVVCSYALHLVEASWLPGVCRALADVADQLLIVTPHKRPEIRLGWGWGAPLELRYERTRVRLYRRVDVQ